VAVEADCTTAEGGGDSAGIGLGCGVSCGMIAMVAVATGVALGKGRGTVADGDGPTTSWQPHSIGGRHGTNKTSREINTRFIAHRYPSKCVLSMLAHQERAAQEEDTGGGKQA
jgi:hypothetical protein